MSGVRVPIGGMLSGAVAGLGVLVVLQQASVLYPTRIATIAAVAAGVVLAFLVVNAGAASRRTAPAGAAAVPSSPVSDPVWTPTHAVVGSGTAAHDLPDPSSPSVPMDGGLDVEVIERRGDWVQVRCSNGWTAWVSAGDLLDASARG